MNITAPSVQEMARLKNNGIKLESKLVTKYVSAAVGKEIIDNFKIGLNKFNFKFVFFFIILIFKSEATVTQEPIPQISALIPINLGKKIIQTNIKIEPTM